MDPNDFSAASVLRALNFANKLTPAGMAMGISDEFLKPYLEAKLVEPALQEVGSAFDPRGETAIRAIASGVGLGNMDAFGQTERGRRGVDMLNQDLGVGGTAALLGGLQMAPAAAAAPGMARGISGAIARGRPAAPPQPVNPSSERVTSVLPDPNFGQIMAKSGEVVPTPRNLAPAQGPTGKEALSTVLEQRQYENALPPEELQRYIQLRGFERSNWPAARRWMEKGITPQDLGVSPYASPPPEPAVAQAPLGNATPADPVRQSLLRRMMMDQR